jgi:hypothetical protein
MIASIVHRAPRIITADVVVSRLGAFGARDRGGRDADLAAEFFRAKRRAPP